MVYVSRTDWGARARTHAPGRLDRSEVVGLAFHWPAMGTRLTTRREVAAALRSWQALHMDTRGWSDIAYQVAVDQSGNRYRLRGLRNRSAANGDTTTNGRYGAVLLVLAEGEQPTAAMIRTTRRVVAKHRRLFPRSTALVGHGAIRPGGTECPGPAVRRLLDAGTFNPK